MISAVCRSLRRKSVTPAPRMLDRSPLETRSAITTFLFLADEPGPVDFSFVLGSPTLSSMEPAIDLYRKGYTRKIVISGMGPAPSELTEADTYKAYAIEQGIPAADLLTETKATNTRENFAFTLPIVERHFGWDNVRSVAISGKPFHMRRALMTARAHWPQHLKFRMLPSNHPDDPPAETWWQTGSGRTFVLAELRAIGTYALAGDIGGF